MHHFFLICFPFPFYKSSLPRSPKWVFPLRYCSIPSFHQQQPDWQSMRDVGLSKLTKKLKGCVYNWMFPWQHGELGTSHDLQVCTDFPTVASAQGAVGNWLETGKSAAATSIQAPPAQHRSRLIAMHQTAFGGTQPPVMACVLQKKHTKAIRLVMLFVPAHSNAIKQRKQLKAQLKLISSWKKWYVVLPQGLWNHQATWLLVEQSLWETQIPNPKTI